MIRDKAGNRLIVYKVEDEIDLVRMVFYDVDA